MASSSQCRLVMCLPERSSAIAENVVGALSGQARRNRRTAVSSAAQAKLLAPAARIARRRIRLARRRACVLAWAAPSPDNGSAHANREEASALSTAGVKFGIWRASSYPAGWYDISACVICRRRPISGDRSKQLGAGAKSIVPMHGARRGQRHRGHETRPLAESSKKPAAS